MDDFVETAVRHDQRFVRDVPAVAIEPVTELRCRIHGLQHKGLQALRDQWQRLEDLDHELSAHARDAGRRDFTGGEGRETAALPHLDLVLHGLLGHGMSRGIAGAGVEVAGDHVRHAAALDERRREIAMIRADIGRRLPIGHKVRHSLQAIVELYHITPPLLLWDNVSKNKKRRNTRYASVIYWLLEQDSNLRQPD